MPEFAGYVVNRLFSIGLRLESARSIVGNGPAGDRIAAATDELDRVIRDVRTAMFGHVADHPAVLTKRWRALADQAEQMARRRERPP